MQHFGRQLVGADVALFYYAGHGMQVSGANYLVPVTANPTREADVDFQMVDVELVLRQMEGAGTRLNLVILDACRTIRSALAACGVPTAGSRRCARRKARCSPTQRSPAMSRWTAPTATAPIRGRWPRRSQAGLDIFQTFNQVGLAVKRADRRFAAALGVVLADRRHILFCGAGGGGSTQLLALRRRPTAAGPHAPPGSRTAFRSRIRPAARIERPACSSTISIRSRSDSKNGMSTRSANFRRKPG